MAKLKILSIQIQSLPLRLNIGIDEYWDIVCKPLTQDVGLCI